MGRRVAAEQIESRVRAEREAAGLSQAALAARAGLTRQAISAIEAGHYLPNTAVALRLAQALGCRVEALFHLPAESPRLAAELVRLAPDASDAPAARRSRAPVSVPNAERRQRVQVARVGERLLARPLSGDAGWLTPADGLVAADRGGGAVDVELLVDAGLPERTVVVLGCDPSLALLGAHLTRRYPSLRLGWVQAGSLAALRGVARGEAHAAGSHLRDPASGEYNLPFVRRELAGRRVQVVTLSLWQQGLIVARGNPRGIAGPADLARPDLTLVTREPGSGSRAFFDACLRAAGRPEDAGEARGARELSSHSAVAEAVAVGAADVGPGIMAAARAFGLDFIPVEEERYDLVLPAEYLDAPPVQALLETAVSPGYRAEVEALGGYDSALAGNLVATLG